MSISELTRVLYELEVPPEMYRLDGTHYELAHVLAHRGSQWIVFLSERGQESDPVAFDRENDACLYLLGRLANDLIEQDRLRVEAQRS